MKFAILELENALLFGGSEYFGREYDGVDLYVLDFSFERVKVMLMVLVAVLILLIHLVNAIDLSWQRCYL